MARGDYNRTDEAVCAQAVELYLQGCTQQEAAGRLNISNSTVSVALKLRGIKVRPRKTSRDILDSMVSAYLDGASLAASVLPFGLDISVLTDELGQRGIPRRRRTPPSQPRKRKVAQEVLDAMVREYLCGKSAPECSQMFNQERSVCYKELKKRGIPRRTSGETLRAQGRKPVNRLPFSVTAPAVSQYKQGGTLSDAARASGISNPALVRALGEAGIPIRPIDHKASGRKRGAKQSGLSVGEWTPQAGRVWKRYQVTPEYKDWRKAILRRDAYKCRDCGTRPESNEFHVHHIWPKARYPHMGLLLENALTLCRECHEAIKAKEESNAPRLLQLIGSCVSPILFYESRPIE